MDDRFDLARFVTAQASGGSFDRALSELRQGHKVSHWMWFVFPQLAGLGRSSMAQRYAISGLEEAQAYLAHDILGPRLIQCSTTVAASPARSAEEIFGSIDAVKLRSSMTLFSAAGTDPQVFDHVIVRYFQGAPDPVTLELLHS